MPHLRRAACRAGLSAGLLLLVAACGSSSKAAKTASTPSQNEAATSRLLTVAELGPGWQRQPPDLSSLPACLQPFIGGTAAGEIGVATAAFTSSTDFPGLVETIGLYRTGSIDAAYDSVASRLRACDDFPLEIDGASRKVRLRQVSSKTVGDRSDRFFITVTGASAIPYAFSVELFAHGDTLGALLYVDTGSAPGPELDQVAADAAAKA